VEVRKTENYEQIEAVRKAQKYIEDNLKEKLTLYDIAKITGYSPWHISKIFKKHIGKSLFDYIRAFRLSSAALMLRDKNTNVLDVALDFVFDTHEGFTRAFSKQFGINPKKYSKNTPPIKLFIPFPAREYPRPLNKGDNDMSEKKESNTVFVQVIEKPERKMILKRGIKAKDYYEYCEEVGCEIWGLLSSIKDALYEPMGLWLPKSMISPGTSLYAQGVEIKKDYSGEIPEGFDVVDLKPCKMMIFQGQPYDDKDFEQEISNLWEVIENYNPKIYGFEWAKKDAPRFQLEPQGYRGYIEGKPVRLI
jgi:AraC family transcriptional regulator